MGVNRAENQLKDRLIKKVADNEQQMRELKSANQPVGADVLKAEGIPSGTYLTAGPVTLATGESATFTLTVTPDNQILTLWNFAQSIYVDVGVVNGDYIFPNGSLLSSAQAKLTVMNWLEWGESSDVTNRRVYKCRIRNEDSSSHSYFFAVKAYLPVIGGVT